MEILSITLLAFLIAISLIAFFLVLEAFFSRRILRTRQALEATPGRAFWIGLVNLGFFGMLALAFAALGNQSAGSDLLRGIALLILIIPAAGIIFGLAGEIQHTGERLAPQKSPFWRSVAGTIAMILACGLPFAGWFGLLPFLCMLGLGGFILSFFGRKFERPAAPDEDESVPSRQQA